MSPIPPSRAIWRRFSHAAGDAKPDAILFNGGFFIPEILRQRVADVMEHWYGKRPVIFENRDLDLAVAVGAAYYSYVRATGAGLLVRGGLPRAYFIGLGGGDDDSSAHFVPGSARRGGRLDAGTRSRQSATGRQQAGVVPLYSSRTRTEDKPGDVVEFPKDAPKAIPICTRR